MASRDLLRIREQGCQVHLSSEAGVFVACRPETSATLWQLRPPTLLQVLRTAGCISEADYQRRALGEDALPLPGVVVLLLLGAGKAALALLGPELPNLSSSAKSKGKSLLREHKVISTYAVRGGEKHGTGRFQLFEDARSGRTARSEGAKLRRRCAVRFFEKINEKLTDWRDAARGAGWPPAAVLFAGDPRLKRLLLDCRRPVCPLPEDRALWAPLPGFYASAAPSLDSLERVAAYAMRGVIAEVRSDADDEAAEA
eukprot:TRINITY_DN72379_c0_g1_i1.p1 TRINITY_DN72379_c0_g1~~TRINITY_DN72379_c0_g1_i1.p1  ORF type:complete len:286 (-),score=43.22 TRINITY_DN72379_c0_g1_i1:663-1430(-)